MAALGLLIMAVVLAAVPYALAVLIGRVRPDWPRGRQLAASALPLPLVLALGSAGVLFDASTRSADACGKDVCSFLTVLGLGGLLLAAFLLVLGFAVANVATPRR